MFDTTTSRGGVAARPIGDSETRRAAPIGGEEADRWMNYLCRWGFKAFWSLTFNPKKFPDGVTWEKCAWLWRHVIVQNLNRELYGKNYRRIVGHSYFGYVVGIEPHKSGLLHMHAATTGRTDWSRACELWQDGKSLRVGTIEIRGIKEVESDLRYVCKYVTKGGELLLWKAYSHRIPAFVPMWYMDGKISVT
jgi:hypothetical protein